MTRAALSCSGPARQREDLRGVSRLRGVRRILLSLGLLPVAVHAGSAAASVLPSTPLVSTGVITGRVTAAVTKAPTERVEVCEARVGESWMGERCAVTNSNGEYVLAGLTRGDYRVRFMPAESSGFVWQYYDRKANQKNRRPYP